MATMGLMLAVLLLFALQETHAPLSGPFDRVVQVDLAATDPSFEGHGPSKRVEYTSEFSGTLHVWTRARSERTAETGTAGADLDLLLCLEDSEGKRILQDDNSGGGNTPYLRVAVEPGRKFTLLVAGAKANDVGKLELFFVAAPETEATRIAAEDAASAITEIRRLRGAKEIAAARALAVEVIEQLGAVDGASQSELESEGLWGLGVETSRLSMWNPSARAWRWTVEHRTHVLPEEHPSLQAARQALASRLHDLADYSAARDLYESVLAVRSRTLPDDDPELQDTRLNLALSIKHLGDLAGARVLGEKVVEVYTRTVPDEDPRLQLARQNLAATILGLGDLPGARALFEKVLAVDSRTLSDEAPALQSARLNVAITLSMLGDLAGARALEEKVLEVDSRTLPDDDPDLQRARQNLGATTDSLGDRPAARALFEKVLEVQSRTLSKDHPDLQAARLNVAATRQAMGDLTGARALQEQALEVFSRTLPDDHPDLQVARLNLGRTKKFLGDLAGARTLFEKVLEVLTRTLPDDHPDLQMARGNLADLLVCQVARAGRHSQAEEMTPAEKARLKERCAKLIGAMCRAQVRAARDGILRGPGREAEERCSRLARGLDESLSFACGYGVFEPLHSLEAESFVLAETTRGAWTVSAELMRKAANAPRYSELRVALSKASHDLAQLARQGATSQAFDEARAQREAAERDLLVLARELSGASQGAVDFDVQSLAAKLDTGESAVGFRRFKKWRVDVVDGLDSTGNPKIQATAIDSLCAFVLRGAKKEPAPTSALTLVDLGPIVPIEAAVRAWREAIRVGVDRGTAPGVSTADLLQQRGEDLRKLVFDPLLASLAGTQHVVVALDDVLHLVPLEALPMDATREKPGTARELVGDRWRIETRATLTELLTDPPAPTGDTLVALGGASFNMPPITQMAEDVLPVGENKPAQAASILRATPWERGFAPLPHTADEARGIGALHAEVFQDKQPVVVLEKRKASREALMELAPKARFLHIATHGWFAPESIKSWNDPEPLDKKSGLGMRMSGEDQVRAMSPMLLCGLALAGANLPENSLGRAPGLVTAEEVSTLELTHCELAVLSACDTNVGERRAGQGMHSLQMALQIAGARSVITSLWKVSDETTKDLMLDFYRRLWIEKKPKWRALWEAKLRIRNTNDESGNPKYTTRDWAAWVLTGNPN